MHTCPEEMVSSIMKLTVLEFLKKAHKNMRSLLRIFADLYLRRGVPVLKL